MKATLHRENGYEVRPCFVPREKREPGQGDLAWLDIESRDGGVVLFVVAEDLPGIMAAVEELAATLQARDRGLAKA